MARGIVQYRGSLKSCNYNCSYCPFAKRRATAGELERDKEDWLRICSSLVSASSCGAVMVVPYGEALIHSCYWEGLARLSGLRFMEKVGAQTNLSFDVKQRLWEYESAGGNTDKLQLWATFHPEMTTVDRFVKQCRELMAGGVHFCAGSVGVPENIDTLRHLREALPENIYLWINRMDGLNRRYTPEEERAFQKIDPLFSQELHWPKADPLRCGSRLFVESDGRMRLCNIGRPLEGNWYEEPQRPSAALCGKKMCSCYLAYGGREDYPEKWFFGRYPLFRIPWKPKALFLDLDGTLVPEIHGGKIAPDLLEYLRTQSRDLRVFLATSRSEKEAVAKCPEIVPLLSGGIYAAGAHVVIYEESPQKGGFYDDEIHRNNGRMEFFHAISAPPDEYRKESTLSGFISGLDALEKTYGFHTHLCRHNGAAYKITLAKPRRKEWQADEVRQISETPPLKEALAAGHIRCFAEQNCLQIVGGGVDKGSGIRQICGLLGVPPSETAAAGNSAEDIPMFRACGFGAAVEGSPEEVLEEADLVIIHDMDWRKLDWRKYI